jgi:hypothetical protein
VATGGGFGGGRGGFPAGGFPGGAGAPGGFTPPGGGTQPGGATLPGGAAAGGQGRRLGGGGFGGESADTQVVALLKATNSRWAAATSGSNQAAPLELASGKPVMAIGGFTGSDPSPTLAEFQKYVAAGEVHYYIGGGRGGRGGPGGDGGSSQIEAWVTANFKATTVGSSTVYDLTTGGTTA